ncbi:hypothetical protein QCA50_011964 [Cerrena zonata]|uniref:Helicase ATP-binding domain-containing protein n=1 Tax=Cerrena zonata TaxID=2478898 RepID=A0AAW0G086_9APHY
MEAWQSPRFKPRQCLSLLRPKTLAAHKSDYHSIYVTYVNYKSEMKKLTRQSDGTYVCPYGCEVVLKSNKRVPGHIKKHHDAMDKKLESFYTSNQSQGRTSPAQSSSGDALQYMLPDPTPCPPPGGRYGADIASAVAEDDQRIITSHYDPLLSPEGVSNPPPNSAMRQPHRVQAEPDHLDGYGDYEQYLRPYLDADGSSIVIQSMSLDDIDCCVHRDLRIIICRSCNTAVEPQSLKTHLHKHNIRPDSCDQLISMICRYYNLCTGTNINPPMNKQPVPYIDILSGLKCTICHYVCIEKTTMEKHIYEKHPQAPRPIVNCMQAAFCQSLFMVPKRYFEVNAPAPQEKNAFTEYLQHNLRPLITTTTIPVLQPNDVPPLMDFTMWHIHLTNWRLSARSRKELLQDAEIPTAKTPILCGVQSIVLAYYKRVRDLIRPCEHGIRRMLLQYPLDPNTSTGFSVLENNTSLTKYATVVTKFIAFALRTVKGVAKSDYSLPLSDIAKSKALELYAIMERNEKEISAVDALHQFLLASVATPNPEACSDRWKCPLTCWIAIWALREDGGFRGPDDYSQVIAKWQYSLRCIYFYEAYQRRDNYSDQKLFGAVKAHAQRYLSDDNFGPFIMLKHHMAYVSSLLIRSPAAPTIVWSPDRKSLTYQESTLHLSDLRSGLAKLLGEIEKSIHELTGGLHAEVPSDFSDNFALKNRQHSFLNQESLSQQHHPVLEHLMNPQNKNSVADLDVNGKLHWKLGNCQTVLRKLSAINRLLSVAAYMIPSQAPRGEEYIETRIRNADLLRNVFYSYGLWFVNQRLKTTKIKDALDFIPMLCPHRLEKILLDYLILLRPIESLLAEQGTCNMQLATLYEEYFFVAYNQHTTADAFGRALEEISENYFGCRLTRRSWRHMCIALKREYLPSIYQQYIIDEVGDLASGHGSQEAIRTYARVFGELAFLTSDRMREFRKFCELWHDLLGLGQGPLPAAQSLLKERRWSGQGSGYSGSGSMPLQSFLDDLQSSIGIVIQDSLQTICKEHFNKVDSTIQNAIANGILEIQANLGARTLNSNAQAPNPHQPSSLPLSYPTPAQRPPPLDRSLPCRPDSPASQDYWADTIPDSVFTTPASDNQNTAIDYFVPPAQHETAPIQRPLTSSHTALTLLRRALKDPNAIFRSDIQELMCRHALDRYENIVVVLPTGGGKSMLWDVPVQSDGEKNMTTIVLAPYISLLYDQARRSEEKGIKHAIWKQKGKNREEQYQLMFGSYENIGSTAFRSYLHQDESVISRVVLDEAHTILTEISFRSNFKKANMWQQYTFPKIYATGTLAPRSVPAFLQAADLAPDTLILRSPTVRCELAYRVVSVKANLELIRIIPHVAKGITKTIFKSNSRGIIFCCSKDDAEKMGSTLGCLIYHASLGETERTEVQKKWREGKYTSHRWIAATSAFCHGIDQPYVDAILFAGRFHDFVKFAQGGARGGRKDKRRCEVIMFTTLQKASVHPPDHGLAAELNAWVDAKNTCRRIGLSLAFDGVSICCREVEGAELCDVCDKSEDRPIKQVIDYASKVKNESPKLDRGEMVEDEYDVFNSEPLPSDMLQKFEEIDNKSYRAPKRPSTTDNLPPAKRRAIDNSSLPPSSSPVASSSFSQGRKTTHLPPSRTPGHSSRQASSQT